MTGFPIDLLPTSLREAMEAQAAMGGYPIESVAPAALAVVSFATQALADVDSIHTPGKSFPLSNLFLILARSGDAKSSQFGLLMKGVEAWQEKQLAIFDADQREYAVAKTIWDRDHQKAEKAGEADTLLRLKANPPRRPADPRNILSKATTNGVYATLEKGWPSMGMFTSEGGSFLGGHSLRAENSPAEFASMMTLLWDGAPIDRTTGEVTMRLRGRRMAGLIMVQPEVASDFLNSPILKTQGLHARFLVASPPPYVPPLADFVGEAEAERKAGLVRRIAPFNARIEELLSHPLRTFGQDGRELRPVTVGFSRPALIHLQDWFNSTARKWRMEEKETFFGRALEHVQRLAGSIAVFDQWHGVKNDLDPEADVDGLMAHWKERASAVRPVIQIEHVEAATAIVEWFAAQWLSIDVPVADQRDTRHAAYIERVSKWMKARKAPASARDIARAPLQRLDAHVRSAVLATMVEDDILTMSEVMNGTAKTIVYTMK